MYPTTSADPDQDSTDSSGGIIPIFGSTVDIGTGKDMIILVVLLRSVDIYSVEKNITDFTKGAAVTSDIKND